jgi:gliding motility-associated-like protein
MKEYNNIGDLYREMFSDYAPEPPASVWEGVKSATQKKPMWKKLTLPFAGTVLVGAVVYLFMVNPNPKESVSLTGNNEQENTENLIVNNEVLIAENLSDGLDKTNTPFVQQVKLPLLTQDLVLPDFSIDNSFGEISEVAAEQIVSDKKTLPVVADNTSNAKNQMQNQEQNPVKTAQNDVQQHKILPVKISKDTTVCENAAVKLYAYNVENIRWNTGETKNIITVYPSYSEQYSVTFHTENTKDTTVYIHINVVKCAEVHIPNAFTPNGDALNDIFLAKTDMELKSFEMTIYSANGRQVIFTSKDINHGWDGTYKGQPQPHGVYIYTVRYIDNFGKLIEKSGDLLLILQ